MSRRTHLIIAPSVFVLFVACLVIHAGAFEYSQEKPPTQALPTDHRQLTPEQRRGRAIYLRGESLAGRPIIPSIGDLEVPASTVQCGGCHGRRGEGKTEGGVTAGNLTWSNLTKSYGHTHPNGRKHGPFTEASFIFAVVHGVDPDRKPLAAAMPRYRMSAEDMSDLIAYLKQIEFDQDPGLTSDNIEVGVPLPTKGSLADVASAMREVLTAYFDDLNSRGGIYNRKLTLHFTEGGDGSLHAAFDSARALARSGDAFAFVGGLSAGADKEMALVASDEEVPFVGPATFLPQIGSPPNRYVFYLQPGAAEQARALVNFADSGMGLKTKRAAVVHVDEYLPTAAATAAIDQTKLRGWKAVATKAYPSKTFDAVRSAQELKDQQVEAVFFFGDGRQAAALLSAADTLAWKPHIFLLGTLSSGELANTVPASFKEKIFLAFPTVPGDITAQGAEEYRSLLKKYKLTPRHVASQIAALAAAKTFVEGLKRAGANLGREELISALESLYDFDTGLMPRLIFGPNRRIGAAGAYMVSINPETKQFAGVSGWVSAN
jgi:ABC-type branched-subunit amino acid transport system substrate-binding protein